MSHLTPEILRAAALRLKFPGAPWRGNHEFMCHAVRAVAGHRCCAEFTDLLLCHGVSLSGTLSHKGVLGVNLYADERSQNLRFDFLNLLAESLED